MKKTTIIPISAIILDEAIYPRKAIDHRRVAMFADNIRDGFTFDPIEVEPVPGRPGIYRILDGAHRWSAYKAMGITEIKSNHTNPGRHRLPPLCRHQGHRPATADGRRGTGDGTACLR